MERKSPHFDLVSPFEPRGDQPHAIEQLVEGILSDRKHQVLLGVTGSGKTFTMAKVIERCRKPTLVISHNKTLAAQLYREFKDFFPSNAVEYFVSYYDFFQPEAYIPSSDVYIEKTADVNKQLDAMRLSATRSLFTRRDVLIVASVSCIFGLGSPEAYYDMMVSIKVGERLKRHTLLKELVRIRYDRTTMDLVPGTFRAQGDVVEIYPTYDDCAIRIESFGDEIERILAVDPITHKKRWETQSVQVFPNSHYVLPDRTIGRACSAIEEELKERIQYFKKRNKLVEAQRVEQRMRFDLEMLRELGYCSGIENYSRHLTGRRPNEPPPTLIDYFPSDSLIIIDESHVSIPQIGGMHRGDKSRKKNLIEFGFRLPSAFDNRPLTFEEFEAKAFQAVYVSATPGSYELDKAQGEIVEQIIRPTGLIDPKITVKPIKGQVDDLLGEIRKRVAANERVLVTTLTKRMAEDLTAYYRDLGIRVRYLHSEIDTVDRMKILRSLRLGEFDVLIGINLLREGLDLPEVSLVAILDADKEGFLRSNRSLIQTTGRCARNINGEVFMYAQTITRSMKEAINETNRRRNIQMDYNLEHGIKPETIVKAITDDYLGECAADYHDVSEQVEEKIELLKTREQVDLRMRDLDKIMKDYAKNLQFEDAAKCRDEIRFLRDNVIPYL